MGQKLRKCEHTPVADIQAALELLHWQQELLNSALRNLRRQEKEEDSGRRGGGSSKRAGGS